MPNFSELSDPELLDSNVDSSHLVPATRSDVTHSGETLDPGEMGDVENSEETFCKYKY